MNNPTAVQARENWRRMSPEERELRLDDPHDPFLLAHLSDRQISYMSGVEMYRYESVRRIRKNLASQA